MVLEINAGGGTTLIIERGCTGRAGELLPLQRRVLIVTDSGVPPQYADGVAAQCGSPHIVTLPAGERSKSLSSFELLLDTMLQCGFTRDDAVIAVGGGMVGDVAGFAAASYMRGVDFYNIPTTLLAQVDSSIGGKTSVNIGGVKNAVGAFHHPRCVLTDPALTESLPARHISNGLAESLKMALTSSEELFELLIKGSFREDMEDILRYSLSIKAAVVERDAFDRGLRHILNFGHTIGHAIESTTGPDELYHGECVALGMLPMCSPAVRDRLAEALHKLALPTSLEFDEEAVFRAMLHDKKLTRDGCVTAVTVNAIGSFELLSLPVRELRERLGIISKGARR